MSPDRPGAIRSSTDVAYRGRAYGLVFGSSFPLPELVPIDGSADPDVVVSVGDVGPPPGATEAYGHLATPDAVVLRFPEVGRFLISSGTEIVAAPVRGLDDRVLRLFVLGPALGVLLHQRDGLALHASSVSFAGRAIAFLGDSEWGKSTMAGASVRAGARLLADDVTWVRHEDGTFVCPPGVPQIKLWPDAADALGWSASKLERVHPDIDKRAVRDLSVLADAPAPLTRIYVLRSDDGPPSDELRPAEAGVELVRHSFAIDLLGPTGSQAANLRWSGTIASAVDVRTLRGGSELDRVVEIAAAALNATASETDVARRLP